MGATRHEHDPDHASRGRFSGKVAVVAGCARPPGIGHAAALRLARGGAAVVCADAVGDATMAAARLDGPEPAAGGRAGDAPGGARYDTGIVTGEVLESVTSEVVAAGDGSAISVAADPFDQSSWEAAAAAAIREFGRVDICCALMGTTGPDAGDGPLLEVPLPSWQRCFVVNVTAPLLLSRACARHMIDQSDGGAIVILSSYSAVRPPAGSGAVASARSAVNRVTEVLALELAPHHIRVNAVLPLGVQSADPRFPNPGLGRLASAEADSLLSWTRTQVPLGRSQDPDETAAAVEFLCSSEASFISGVSLPVAGGSHTHD
jgi:NAD(P)-dependent dehydrogenase (short-subunit alcohol dehydrogenase family)